MAAFAVQELLSAIMVILVLELALVLSQKNDYFEAEIAPVPSIYHRVANKKHGDSPIY